MLPVALLDVGLQLIDLLEEAFLVLLLRSSVFFDLLSNPCYFTLELLASRLAISDKLLVLCDILLQVIENLELLV